jgi:3',5'-cyclic AMP phosphodiesterase CpdA
VLGVRVVVVADSHLSERTPEAAEHWGAVLAHLAADPPALVVHAGDISADGSSRPTDLGYAHGQLQRVTAPLVAVPGNHDVGDNPGLFGPQRAAVDADRLNAYRSLFGLGRFSEAVGRWRIVGIDSQLFGVGGVEEAGQWSWLEGELADAGGTPVVLVSHKPLVPPPGDHDRPARYVPAPARDRLLALLDAATVPLVVSGHVHQSLRHEAGGRLHVWAPTTWAVLPDNRQRPVGEKKPGILELALADDGRCAVEVLRPPGLRPRVIGVDAVNPYDHQVPPG